MLWFLLVLLVVQVYSQEDRKIIIEDVQASWSLPASTIILNITWNFNDKEPTPNDKPLFTLVQASDERLEVNAAEPCEPAALCHAVFPLIPTPESGEYKFHLQVQLENGPEDFDDIQIAVNITGSQVNVSVSTSSPTSTMLSTSSSSPTTTTVAASHDTNPNKSTIIGAAVGSAIVLILIIIGLIYLCRRRFRRRTSTIGFDRTLMVKDTGPREVKADTDSRRYSDHLYTSVSTASAVISDPEHTENQTERQMEIDERLHHLHDLLSTLESQPQTGNDESIGKVKDRIKRFTVLKEEDWAREISDEKPIEL